VARAGARSRKLVEMKFLLAAFLALAQTAPAAPARQLFDRLPANMEVLTHFGDVNLADNQRRVHGQSFGDAMIDLRSREIRCLTQRWAPRSSA
jgi:hypothetical protein